MHSISFTVSRAFTAMLCHAVTLRKDTSLPRQQIRIVSTANKVATAVRSTNTASRLPVKSAPKTRQVLPQHTSLPKCLLGNVSSAIRAAAAVKIQQRHERILAKLAPVNKRPKQQPVKATRPATSPVTATTMPASTMSSPSMPAQVSSPAAVEPASSQSIPSMPAPFAAPTTTPTTSTQSSRSMSSQVATSAITSNPRRYGWLTINMKLNYRQCNGLEYFQGHITHRVPISNSNFDAPSRIPSAPTSLGPRLTFTPRRYSSVVVIPPRRRGTLPYCPGRPCTLDREGNIYRSDYGRPWDGLNCACHGKPLDNHQYWFRPEDWGTTPAEEDVNPLRPRKVRFGSSEVVTTFERWYEDAWGHFDHVVDPATEADDDAEILAHDLSTLSLEALPSPPPPPPVKSDFQTTWEELMAEGFDDDED